MAKKHKKPKSKSNIPPPSPEQLEKVITEMGGIKVSKDQLAKDRDEAIETLKHAFSLPNEGETTAIAIAREKTAALFYDRVWSPFAPLVPQDIHFCGATPAELELIMFMIQALRDKDLENEAAFSSFIGKKFKKWGQSILSWEKGKFVEVENTTVQRKLTEGMWEHHKVRAVPIYVSAAEQDSDFGRGNKKAIIAALSNLPLPIEEGLSWEQVDELRKDGNARTDLRRLIHWFGREMVGKSQAYVADHLAITLDNYTRSLRKHGIKTTLSAFAGTFSAISIPTLLTHIVQQPLWVSLLEGIAIGSGALAKVAEKYIDTKPEPPAEVAWVYEVKDRME